MFFLARQHNGGVLATVVNETITANQSNFNLYNYLSGLGYDLTAVLEMHITIASGVQLTASATSQYAYRSGSFAAGSTIDLVNSGFIVGRGGAGGAGRAAFAFASGYPGGSGGTAMYIEHDHRSFSNGSGVVGGGGGGGGGGADGQTTNQADEVTTTAGGGGGGGAGYGSLGLGGDPAFNGTTGTVNSAGVGGIGYGAGGAGGALGTAGTAGSGGSPTFSLGGAAGAAGAAIIKNGNTFTVTVTGSISGTVS